MNAHDKEVFNVDVQSTRRDGYRRGGFSLKRGLNHLENVGRQSLIQIKRDSSLLVHKVEPVGVDSTRINTNVEIPAGLPPRNEDAGAQLLDTGELTLAERLAALIPQLTPEQFTQGGVPDTKALSAVAGEAVTAADRDAAFALYQQQYAFKE